MSNPCTLCLAQKLNAQKEWQDQYLSLPCRSLNRHGLIAGATGTGKTVSLRVLAEAASDAGINVFLPDIKGDLSGLGLSGGEDPSIQQRAEALTDGVQWAPKAFPVRFWDVFQKSGIPLRASVSEFGPVLLARALGLNETQEAVLTICFQLADDESWLLLDLEDLRALLHYVSEHAKELAPRYGHIATASVASIQRRLLQLETQGGGEFFTEPGLQIEDLLVQSSDGRGLINVLDARQLFAQPLLYSTLLFWLLASLYEHLPEQGDQEKPKMLFFFDEAHLLFTELSPALLQRLVQMVRMIRSKGVGVFFVTQHPKDLPEDIAAQLGHRIQHSLRAFTPAELRAVQAAADSLRSNPNFDTREEILHLATGQALLSYLQEDGTPSEVELVSILPCCSALMPMSDEERLKRIVADPLYDRYAERVNPESAHEILNARWQQKAEEAQAEADENARQKAQKEQEAEQARQAKLAAAQARQAAAEERREAAEARRQAQEQARIEKEKAKQAQKQTEWLRRMTNSAVSAVGREVGRSIIRGILGTFTRR